MAKTYAIPLVLAIILGLLIVFAPQIVWQARMWFVSPPVGTGEHLLLENQNLKTELAKLQNIKAMFPEGALGSIPAVVYSRYPFNFKNQFLVNAGTMHGVSVNAAVTFGGSTLRDASGQAALTTGGVLVGKVVKAFDDMALIHTVFESEFQTPVRIGDAGIEALFKGGNLPKAVFIPIKSEVQKGDIIYSSSPDFPYGLPIGEIADVIMSADQLFKEATIAFAYDINAIQAVLIAK